MKKFFKNTKVIAVATVLSIVTLLSMTGCAAMQQGVNTMSTEMSGRDRTIEVYSLDGQLVDSFECRCTIEYENGRVLFDDLDTNKRTAVYGNSIVIATDKG